MSERSEVEPGSVMGAGWQRYVFPGIWLVYLLQTVDGVGEHSSGWGSAIGYTVIVAFCAAYLAALPMSWHGGAGRSFWLLYALGWALMAAEAPFAHQDALVFCVYLAVLSVASHRRWSLAAVVALTVLATVLPAVVPGWPGRPDWGNGITVLLVSFAMYGFFHIIRTNRELAEARAEVARLAAEGERTRIARDLHDLLGHSLTTITVKAGLARRLGERGDDDRARTEIAEVEALSRRTLGDVRAAVAGHREVTLAGELATAREVLRAAAIDAELPGSVDVVAPELSEVFGWVLREGVTNLVRHSHAQHCRVVLGRRSIEIVDDGIGRGAPSCGSGLTGLHERVEAVGGSISAGGGFSGFRLRVEVPLAASAEPAPRTPPAAPASIRSAPA